MWDLPGPGLEPVSPALVGRFLTTVPPGESRFVVSFKMGKCESSNFVLIVLTLLGPVNFHMIFRISLPISVKKLPGILIVIVLSL